MSNVLATESFSASSAAQTNTRMAEGPAPRPTGSTPAGPQHPHAAMNETAELKRQLLDAWAAGVDAALKATFELQNAEIAAGLSLFKGAGDVNRVAIEQWAAVVHQAQQAMLETLHANVLAADERAEGAWPSGVSAG